MLIFDRDPVPQIVRRFVIALCLSMFSASCGAKDANQECSGGPLYGECVITSGSHAGFEAGMSKEAAFENACKLATQHKIWDPIFYVSGALQAHPGISMCDLKTEAMASDKWSFIEAARVRERYINLEFANEKIVAISLQDRGLDP